MTPFQRLVYDAVDQLGGNAYGTTIMRAVESERGRFVSIGSLYVTLGELEEMGLIRSQQGEATAERGWHPKRYYYIARRPEEKP